MITEQDLQAAIAECQGERHPTASTCIKLAAFYTIKQHLFPERTMTDYSFAPAPDETPSAYVTIRSDTEFAKAIGGLRQDEVWPVIDELMTTIKALHPRLYDAVLAKF